MLLLIYMTHKQGLVLIPGKVSFFIPGKVVTKMDIIIRYSGIANKSIFVSNSTKSAIVKLSCFYCL